MDEKKQIPDKKKGKDVITVKANKKGRHVMKFMNFLRIFIIPIVRIIFSTIENLLLYAATTNISIIRKPTRKSFTILNTIPVKTAI